MAIIFFFLTYIIIIDITFIIDIKEMKLLIICNFFFGIYQIYVKIFNEKYVKNFYNYLTNNNKKLNL